MLEHALACAAVGWPVLPLRPRLKTPATRHGLHDATCDPATIRSWWEETPDLNIGVNTGAAGLVVIDVDAPPDDIGAGWTTWCALVDRHAGVETRTFEVDTPSGGAHLYYAAPAGVRIKNSASKLGPHVDVRATGGYVVVPPSVTDAGRYTVSRTENPAPLPAWLLALLVDPPRPAPAPRPSNITARLGTGNYAAAALEAEVDTVRNAVSGTRNHVLNVASFNLGQLVGAGQLDAGTVAAELLSAAIAAGLGDHEAEATIRSGLEAGLRDPRRVA